MIDLVLILIWLIGIAMLSIEAVDSELATSIKNFLNLKSDDKNVNAFRKFGFFKKLLGNWFWLFLIVVIPIVLFFKLYHFLARLSECIYCFSFWAGFAFTHFYLEKDIILSIVFGGLTVFITRLIDKHVTLK